ncbi:MAG: TonB-dependent receptor [Balneola sp.]|nr:TonB-dependent receptor [Balneola sp.]MBO6651653.1 TonB-dependent receptor [Balneola sp.]MBO6711941.1 TonB-dependent receptor [Balneola sp.]MBO6800136.1 TonB-dependent receptor [Balneola sp.]MBO6871641.1 TonB-dependent receptor [Balneola sp.]
MKNLKHFLTLLLWTCSIAVFAQGTGQITGTIVDAENGETIIGASVGITGTTKGSATDLDGHFSIRNLEAGTYSLTVSYISYTTQTVTGIVVYDGESTSINIALETNVADLDEVVVTAEAIKSGEAGLLSIQRKAIAVQDGISSEELSRSTDGNVGSAMKRVSGVTVVGGKDVYVRGLGNRYSNVQLNGSPIPSTNPNKKEAPVDILSSGIVDNIVVQKTYTPDQSGEFSGGSVQIVTKEFPNNPNITFSYTTDVNTNSTFKNYLGYSGGGTDFLGYDNGFRSLPEDVEDSQITNTEEAGRIVSSLNNSWASKNIQSLPGQKFGFSYSNQFNQDKMPIGIVSNVSYKYATDSRTDESFRYINNFNENTGETLLGSDYIRNSGEEKTSLNGMLNIFAKPNELTKIGMKNLYSNSSNNQYSTIEGSYYNFDNDNRQTVAEFDRRAIYSSSLIFETYFQDFMESSLDASITYSKAVRDLPDRRTTQYVRTDTGDLEVILPFRGNSHFFSYQNDNNYSAKLDYDFKPVEKLNVKVGGFALYKDRDFESYKLIYEENPSSNAPDIDKTLSAEEIFTTENILNESLLLTERTSSRDSYNGEQELAAGYFSLNWSPTSRWNFVTGLRAENSSQSINSDVLVDELDLLPAFNATFRPSEKTNLRGAFSITLARPEFRELSEFNFQDFVGGRTVFGNSDLQRTKIFNYDLRLETFPNVGELFAFSLFYKKFENPIEVFYRITQNNEVRYDNVESANLYGVEVEGRKDITEKLRLSSNFSYILSGVEYADGASAGRQANADRPMFGQSPYTLNMNAFYLMPSIDSELTLSFNKFGERISAVGNNEQPDDEYEQSFDKLDLSFTKNFRNASINASIENILGDNVVYKQGDIITNQYEIGTSFSISFSYSFN